MDDIRTTLELDRRRMAPLFAGALWSLTLVTDAEALYASRAPALPRLPELDALAAQEAGATVLESLLPEVRALALLLASRRAGDGVSPVRFADASDWLAARCHLLGLSHVALPIADLPLLDIANRRLAALLTPHGHSVRAVQPMLLTRAQEPEALPLLRGWGALAYESLDEGGGVIAVSRALCELCRQRWEALCLQLGL